MYEPNYTITDHLLNVISRIEPIRGQVDITSILPAREAEIRLRATVEATHSSTSIEGNPLNIKQVESVLSQKTQLGRYQYYEVEVQNYKKALDFIDKRKVSHGSISQKDILVIHKILTKGLLDQKRSGAWRKNPVYIENQDGEKVYDAVEAGLVKQKIDELLVWLDKDSHNIHPVIAAAILHFQFVSIHPFADGNGRTARILTMLYLGLCGYDFRGSLVLDSYYASDKRSYYKALRVQGDNYASAEKADLTSWIEYFADGFLASVNVLNAEIALITASVQGNMPSRTLSRAEMDILSYIKQFGSITISEAEGILRGVPRRTIQRKLRKMSDEGFIRPEGLNSGTKYISN